MNLLKSICARIFALYALLLFIVSMLPVLIWLYANKLCMPPPKFTIILHKTFRVWMGFFLPAIFCPVRVHGAQFFEKNKNYVVVANHASLLDIPISSPYIPGANKTLGKISFAKAPLFGFIYKAGSILVDRSSAISRARSLVAMKECLAQGLHLCLYPEGTRNKTTEPLLPFHDGAFKVAIAAQKDIVPAIISGTKKAMPNNKFFWLWPAALSIVFLPPISTQGLTAENIKELKQEIFDLMKAKIADQ